ncbi:MAG: PRC-barrel domain-containing protein [Alphaproteobacteria bacterium]
MNKLQTNTALVLAGLALLGAGSMPAHADNVAQTVELVKVDVQKLSTGYRTSKIIGSNVVNDSAEIIGKIDDLIVSPDDNKSAYVILSVGGWLGMGTHLIALPYSNLRISSVSIVLPGATKEGLKTLPEFKYSTM